ncbi:uncharacterized protein LOC127799134 [Diospyros lotus]|uniref:uncharacterized protein LOC127799134 n=1 Tax=Diospyros lotus TaxID=55363 RepID=UPI002259695E|nr:uncharacterized protein LOC127799134 [Diospyros lotus]
MASHLKPFQLLEINIISAQDLEQVSRKMRTYATAWVHPKRKLLTSVDSQGHNNPTWNDKFVFRVDEEFLRCDTSAVMIEIHAAHWFRDALVGSVRVLVGNLFPPTRPRPHNHHVGMRFAALQVRRPSGRPQGILNIGVTVLDSSMRSMPLYTLAASAVGYRDLIQEGHPHGHGGHDDSGPGIYPPMKSVLFRSRSERSFAFDDHSVANGSVISVSQNKPFAGKASSVISISEVGFPATNEKTVKKGKASSIIGGAEFIETPKDKGYWPVSNKLKIAYRTE